MAIEILPKLNGIIGLMIFGTPPMSKPPKMEKAYLANQALGLFYQKELNKEQISYLADNLVYNKKTQAQLEKILTRSSAIMRELTPIAMGIGNYDDECKIVAETNTTLAIIHGEYDSFVNPDYFNTLVLPTLWRNKIQVIPDAGHCPQMENPKVFNSLLLEFIQDIS